jgi:hypothetical protein
MFGLTTNKKLREAETRSYLNGCEVTRFAHKKVYVTAENYTAARVAALQAAQGEAKFVCRPEHLQGIRGGILLVGHHADYHLIEEAKGRDMTLIEIRT